LDGHVIAAESNCHLQPKISVESFIIFAGHLNHRNNVTFSRNGQKYALFSAKYFRRPNTAKNRALPLKASYFRSIGLSFGGPEAPKNALLPVVLAPLSVVCFI
jgi:hypothetical protein